MNKEYDIIDNKVECGDVYYTFKGAICKQLKGGVNNVLYGKRVNLSEMYNRMIDDVIEYIIGGRSFLEGKRDKNDPMDPFFSI